MKYHFITSCVNARAKDINDMVDNAREIQYETFRRYVCIKELEEILGYDKYLRIKDDYMVSFYRSKYKNSTCVYICWSSIEFVFCP